MPTVDYKWAKQQLNAARARRGAGDAALELLKAWEGITIEEALIPEAVELFSTLAKGHAFTSSDPTLWVDAFPGGPVRVGTIVRIKADAFDGKSGKIHNGRVGKVVAIRSGDVIVNSTDGIEPLLNAAHYPFQALQFRAR